MYEALNNLQYPEMFDANSIKAIGERFFAPHILWARNLIETEQQQQQQQQQQPQVQQQQQQLQQQQQQQQQNNSNNPYLPFR